MSSPVSLKMRTSTTFLPSRSGVCCTDSDEGAGAVACALTVPLVTKKMAARKAGAAFVNGLQFFITDRRRKVSTAVCCLLLVGISPQILSPNCGLESPRLYYWRQRCAVSIPFGQLCFPRYHWNGFGSHGIPVFPVSIVSELCKSGSRWTLTCKIDTRARSFLPVLAKMDNAGSCPLA